MMPNSGFSIELWGETVQAEYLKDKAPAICRSMSENLPVVSQAVHAKFAGEELIVMVPFLAEPENEILNVKKGDVGYYPGRQTICIFYGEIHPFGKVSVFARITNGFDILFKAASHILSFGTINTKIIGY